MDSLENVNLGPEHTLISNRDLALTHTQKVIGNNLQAPSAEFLNRQLFDSLRTNDFSKAIATLSQLKDKRSGIHTYIDEESKSLVRDAREVKEPIIAPESYSIQCVNHARAALIVTENAFLRGEINKEQHDQIKLDIIKNMKRQVDEIQNGGYRDLSVQNQMDEKGDIAKIEKKVKGFNTSLVETLQSAGIKKPQEQIRSAKEFANFQDEHYHVTTLSAVGTHVVAETEVMHLSLTEKQKQMFEAIRRQYNSPEAVVSGEHMDWFNRQPTWKKDMIHAAAPAILSGTKVIPTQLRDCLPLIRNAYTKVTSVAENGGALTPVLETMHSGTLTTASPSNDNELLALTTENAKQLQQFSRNGKVNLNPLTSPANFIGEIDVADEKYLTQVAANSEGKISKTSLPFNMARLFVGGGGRDLSGARNSLNLLASKLGNGAVKNYLTGKGSFKKAKEAIGEDITLMHAIEAKRIINSLSGIRGMLPSFSDKNNTHSQLAERMQIISSDSRYDMPRMNVSCASGKDRTGLVLEGASIRVVVGRTGADPKAVATAMTKAGHTQHMAGSNGGGSLGCFGVKPETIGAANQSIFGGITAKVMGNRTADLNKFKINKPSRLERIKHFIMGSPKVDKTIIATHTTTENNSRLSVIQAEAIGEELARNSSQNVYRPLPQNVKSQGQELKLP